MLQVASSRRFGVFEVNLQARELRKHGTRVKLSGHSFEILSMLLERPGEIVTRDQLRARLWPVDTFVDFEHGLNTAVKRLRATLGDSPESPRYIETLPRVGYRFIAPVLPVDAERTQTEAMLTQRLPVRYLPSSVSSHPESAGLSGEEERSHRFRPLQNKALGISMAAVVVLGIVYLSRPIVPPPRVIRIRQITHLGTVEAHQNLATDGPRLYFRDKSNGQRSLKYVASDGGEAYPLPSSSAEFDIGGISPDGSKLLMESVLIEGNNPLWVLPTGGGSPLRLGNTMAIDSEWSADGRKLAYMVAEEEVYLAHADGSEPRKLAEVPGTPYCPRWSPDAKRLRFVIIRSETNRGELWEVAMDGKGGPHPLLPNWGNGEPEWGGSWSPDGKYYFFSSSVQGVKCVWALRERTDWWHKVNRTPVQLTSGPISYSLPRVSRDGKTLFVIGEEHRGLLLHYSQKSGRFEPFSGGLSADHVSFSRDSEWMAYVSYPEGTLWRSKVDGTERLQLSSSPLQAYVPRWSPDGKWIAFAGSKDLGQNMKLYRVPANGLTPPEELVPDERAETYPSWSSDGNQIVFSRVMRPDPADALELVVLDVNTRRTSIVPDSRGLFEPQWSPDGHYLTAISVDHNRLMLFDSQTRQWRSLGAENAHYVAWSPDGKYIHYLEMPDNFSQEKDWNADRMRLADHKVERLCSLHSLNLTGVYGWWSGPALDGLPLVLNDVSRRDIYAIDTELP